MDVRNVADARLVAHEPVHRPEEARLLDAHDGLGRVVRRDAVVGAQAAEDAHLGEQVLVLVELVRGDHRHHAETETTNGGTLGYRCTVMYYYARKLHAWWCGVVLNSARGSRPAAAYRKRGYGRREWDALYFFYKNNR